MKRLTIKIDKYLHSSIIPALPDEFKELKVSNISEKKLEILILSCFQILFPETIVIHQEEFLSSVPDIIAIDKIGRFYIIELKIKKANRSKILAQNIKYQSDIAALNKTEIEDLFQKTYNNLKSNPSLIASLYSELNDSKTSYDLSGGNLQSELDDLYSTRFGYPPIKHMFNKKWKLVNIAPEFDRESQMDLFLTSLLNRGFDVEFYSFELYTNNKEFILTIIEKTYEDNGTDEVTKFYVRNRDKIDSFIVKCNINDQHVKKDPGNQDSWKILDYPERLNINWPVGNLRTEDSFKKLYITFPEREIDCIDNLINKVNDVVKSVKVKRNKHQLRFIYTDCGEKCDGCVKSCSLVDDFSHILKLATTSNFE